MTLLWDHASCHCGTLALPHHTSACAMQGEVGDQFYIVEHGKLGAYKQVGHWAW